MAPEKRRLTSVPFKVKAALTVDEKRQTIDHLDNLSVGGCLLPLKNNLRPGTSCQLEIWMSGSSSDLNIEVEGEIVLTATGLTAVKFTRIEPDSLFHLQNIVLYNAEDPAKVEQDINASPGIR